jgi:hypothetical protein
VSGSQTGCSTPFCASTPCVESKKAARRLVDLDQGAERWTGGVVDHQEQPKLRGVRQFIRASWLALHGNDVGDRRAGLDVDRDHAARGVGYEEPGIGGFSGHDTVGTGAIVGTVPGGSAWQKPAERWVRGQLLGKGAGRGVDDIDRDV